MQETVLKLNNQLDEFESLSEAVSSCLDNLAEEVSVCHRLLLMGGEYIDRVDPHRNWIVSTIDLSRCLSERIEWTYPQ